MFMSTHYIRHGIFYPALLIMSVALPACERKKPPVDLIKPQREAMEKARAVEQVLQKGVDDNGRKIDDQSK